MSVFLFIIIIVGLVMFGEVAKSWLGARASRPEVEPGGGETDEVERLREHVSLLAQQVDRLTEEQRFLTRLLETDARRAPRPSEMGRTDHDR